MNEVGLSLPQDVGIKDRTMVWLGIPRILTGIRMAITHGGIQEMYEIFIHKITPEITQYTIHGAFGYMTTPFQSLWLLGHTSVCRNVKAPAGTYKDQMLLEERVDASWHIRIMKALCSTISMVGYLRLWSRVQNRALQSIWFVSKHGIYIYIQKYHITSYV